MVKSGNYSFDVNNLVWPGPQPGILEHTSKTNVENLSWNMVTSICEMSCYLLIAG